MFHQFWTINIRAMKAYYFLMIVLLLQGCAFYKYNQIDLEKKTPTTVIKKNMQRRYYNKTEPYYVVHYTDSISDVSFFLDSVRILRDTLRGIAREITEVKAPSDLAIKDKYYQMALAFIKKYPFKTSESRKIKLKERWHVEQTHVYIIPPESVHLNKPFLIANDQVQKLDIMKLRKREWMIIAPSGAAFGVGLYLLLDFLFNGLDLGFDYG